MTSGPRALFRGGLQNNLMSMCSPKGSTRHSLVNLGDGSGNLE
jgi:hypothetical protein